MRTFVSTAGELISLHIEKFGSEFVVQQVDQSGRTMGFPVASKREAYAKIGVLTSKLKA